LRIGLKESLVEEAIAQAYDATLVQIQRANMLLGNIGETLQLAAERRLAEARMRLFHPLGFMLASPAESAEDALSYFQNAWVEDKYDGIRAQAHCSGDTVRFFSRTRDEITESFPELPEAFAGLPQDAILDGEIVAWSYLMGEQDESGRALPFNALQQRLGRKRVSEKLMREVPVTYLVFDVLYAGSELLIDRPQRERTKILNELLAAKRTPDHEGHQVSRRTTQSRLSFETDLPAFATQIVRAPAFGASSPQELDQLFDAAQARGNEGLMIKDPESPYTPGRRGKSWLKLKRELAMLDVVVTAAEYGHGKRIGVLSDYTFAIRDGDRLRNIGKAYSGLTDTEIAEMTKWFLGHTIEDQGFRRIVEPKIVLEVAFNNIMKSDRHNSGYALRFPRIVRLRQDKLPEEADTMERVEEIYKGQSRGHEKK
jgi:DNA ligase-1